MLILTQKMVDIFPCTAGVDLFPCSADIHGIVSTHLETVACLRREKVDGYIEMDYNVDK